MKIKSLKFFFWLGKSYNADTRTCKFEEINMFFEEVFVES